MLLGYPEQALAWVQRALTPDPDTDHPWSLAFALTLAARLHQFRREGPAAQARSDAALELATDRGWPQIDAMGALLQGWALTAQGQGEAELYRLQGECLLAQEGQEEGKGQKVGEAEACFQQALKVARRQRAKSLELRAALSLSRLWQRQGKREHAGAVPEWPLLAEIYGWFTEGFDTADLQEAKLLLDERS